ncbi:hypothetical protein GC176_01690 [bacterium]|nr:hypothetical protein [bacterium]
MRATNCRQSLLVVFALLWLLSAPAIASAQKLGAIKAAASGDSSSSNSGSSSTSSGSSASSRKSSNKDKRQLRHHYSSCDDNDDALSIGFSEFSGQLLMAALSTPFVLPRAYVSDTDLQPVTFPDFPYSDSQRRSLGELLGGSEPPPWHLTLRGQYGDDFSGLSHASGRVLWDSTYRLGLDSEFFYRHERLPGGSDQLWTGDANVVYTFAKGELGQFRVGIGVNWLAAAGQSDSGFNFTYGGEIYPADPFVITADIDWGRVGAAALFHGRTTIGVTRDGWGVFTGYDYFSVGDVGIHAWINGVELRF